LLDVRPRTGPAPVAVRDVFLDVHEGLFAGPSLRWLYFISGLLGTAMIGSGLILWTVKRRQRREKRGEPAPPGARLVERLNVGTVIGLPVAIAAYFWANRLLPASIVGRAEWEIHALFLSWVLMLAHAALRPSQRAWREQLWVAAVVYALLPVLNASTTDRGLVKSVLSGDWVFAGFDLTMLALGIAFGVAALGLERRFVPRADAIEASPRVLPALGQGTGG
jgi:uncharacterized iron-regulated membrane protein